MKTGAMTKTAEASGDVSEKEDLEYAFSINVCVDMKRKQP